MIEQSEESQLAERRQAIATIEPLTLDVVVLNREALPPVVRRVIGDRKFAHWDRVLDIATNVQKKGIATACADGTARLWDETGTLLAVFVEQPQKVPPASTREARSVALSSDGKYIAVGHSDRLKLFDIADGTLLHNWDTNYATVSAVDFHPKGNRLASSGPKNSISLWEISKEEAIGELSGHTSDIEELKFSPDGTLLVSTDDNGKVMLWNVADQTNQQLEFSDAIFGKHVDFSPDGNKLILSGHDMNIRVCDLQEKTVQVIPLEKKAEIARFLPEGDKIAVVSDSKVGILNINGGHYVGNPTKIHLSCNGLAVSSDGSRAYAIGWDTRVRVVDTASQELLGLPESIQDPARAIAYSADGKSLAVNEAGGGILQISRDGTNKRQLVPAPSEPVYNKHFALSPDGKFAADVGNDDDDDHVLRLNKINGEPKSRELKDHEGRITDLVFSPDSKTLASGGEKIFLWNVENGELLETINVGCYAMDFHPDGKSLVIAHAYDLYLAELGGKEPRKIGNFGSQMKTIRYHPGGNQIATQGLYIYNVETDSFREDLKQFDDDAYFTTTVDYNCDGTLMLATSQRGDVQVWETTNYQPVFMCKLTHNYGLEDAIVGAVFSPVLPREFTTLNADGSIYVFELPTKGGD